MDRRISLAARIMNAAEAGRPLNPITDDDPDFDLAAAYDVAGDILRARMARGEAPVGWKIGFTNRTIWPEYGVYAPIWGPMYDSTVAALADAPEIPLERYFEPRIEPEIAFRLARPPEAEMDEEALLSCIDAVTHGFEIVHSLFPGWRFRAADTVAAFGLHGCFRHGPWVPVEAARRGEWRNRLSSFTIVISRDGAPVDRGEAENVLGGPLSALRHFVADLARRSMGRGLEAGDVVTTGTVTGAFPVAPGECWTSAVTGLTVPGLTIRFR